MHTRRDTSCTHGGTPLTPGGTTNSGTHPEVHPTVGHTRRGTPCRTYTPGEVLPVGHTHPEVHHGRLYTRRYTHGRLYTRRSTPCGIHPERYTLWDTPGGTPMVGMYTLRYTHGEYVHPGIYHPGSSPPYTTRVVVLPIPPWVYHHTHLVCTQRVHDELSV